ncbi:Dyp-type peroxidase [Methylocella sp.]|jgi:Dyp-type peroxidase family|uniref:Dyp-type peroxidase n=1 Tax=Methylocella sp. TaxID=1978226 RepID=UPI003C247DF8
MVAGSLARRKRAPNTQSAQAQAGTWRLAPDVAAQAQGLIASPFEHLPEAQALFLQLSLTGGAWLRELTAVVPITDATGKVTPSSAIAFTATGLTTMGLPPDQTPGFLPEFVEGMRQLDRQRRLGDEGDGADDRTTVIKGGPLWSGNAPDPLAPDPSQRARPTPITVHALLLLYEADDAALQALTGRAKAALAGSGVAIAHELRLSLHADPTIRDMPREHFGFADGISQPVPFGAGVIVDDAGKDYPRDPLHCVAAGDLLLGQINAHGEPAPGPLAPDTAAAKAPRDGGAHYGMRDLGLNGSYLVVRELKQNVAAFWNSMDTAAKEIARDGVDPEWVAERIVGRRLNGDPLAPPAALPAPGQGDPCNDFRYADHDPNGLTCPLGSHIRRCNPRDGLAPTPNDAAGLLQARNNHRIMRRGRKYGPPIADRRVEDGENRGLLFMCINTDLARQFELVQQTWMLNNSFAVLDDETDPLLGPPGPMTIPHAPLRLCPQVKSYVLLAGGEYFFLPSLPALTYLAAL